MHILLIHQAFASIDEPGGTRHHELARYLAQQGHRLTVIASPVSYLTGGTRQERMAWAAREQDPDYPITIVRAYTYRALHRSFVHRVFSFLSFMVSSFFIGLQTRDVDLVWGTSPPIFQGLTAWALARLKRAPFLFEVRDLWPAFAIAVGVLRNGLLIRLSEWLERFLYRHADQVMVNSPGFQQHVTERGAQRVTLIPNGADPRMFDPRAKGSAFRQAHDLGDKFVVLYAGAHGLSNDLGVVLQAAQQLQDQPEIQIVLLGAGKEKTALVDLGQQFGLHNVTFADPLPKTEVGAALAAADACLAILKPIPLYKTVYPNKVFDYMAAGRPVLLAIDGVIRELVEQADAGVFTPPGDAGALADSIRRLAQAPQAAAAMGANGRRFIETNFDRAQLAEQLARLLAAMTPNH